MTDHKPTLLLDADGVLVAFILGALASMKQLFGIEGQHDDVTTYEFEKCFDLDSAQMAALVKAWSEPGWCAALPIYPWVAPAVAELKQLAIVHPVTQPFPSPTWITERDQWLKEHLGFPRNEIIHAHADTKHMIRGDVFVDDKAVSVAAWQKAHPNGVGILWARAYNVVCHTFQTLDAQQAEADDRCRRCHRTARDHEQPPWTGLRTSDWNDVIGIVKAMRWIPARRSAW